MGSVSYSYLELCNGLVEDVYELQTMTRIYTADQKLQNVYYCPIQDEISPLCNCPKLGQLFSFICSAKG